jgi:hypothetical protein
MIIDQLASMLPKDNEEVNVQVKRLQAMLDVAIMVDPVLERGDRARGQDPDHCQSPCKDSARNLTLSEGCSQGRDRDDKDLHNVISNRDARDRIENQCQERDYDYYGPFCDQPH